jgi:hypothetical protein
MWTKEDRALLLRLVVAVEKIASVEAGPVGFRITETALSTSKPEDEVTFTDNFGPNFMKEDVMPANVDLQILDDGKGVLFTLQPVNKAGNPEPLPPGDVVTATSSAPASLAVAPNPGDTTGLVFLGTVPQPPVDATGIVVTFSAAFGSTAANPIDVVADNSPVGFTITESAQ